MEKILKKQKNIHPSLNDKVKLRGRSQEGILERIENKTWCIVKWTSEETGPKIVHLYELEKI